MSRASASTVRNRPRPWSSDRREIGTTYAFAPPRIYENLLTLTMVRMEDASALKRRMFDFFIEVARRWGEKILNKETVPLHARLAYGLGELLVYGPLKNRFGLSRIRVAYTAGEAIGPEIFRFFRSLGINLKQLYGATEAVGLHHGAARRRNLRRHGRQAEYRRRGEGRRQRRGDVPLARRVPGLLQGSGADRRNQDAGRLGAFGRRRLLRPEERTPEDHRSRQGRRHASTTARCSRRNTSRTSSSSIPTSRKRWRSAISATSSASWSTST